MWWPLCGSYESNPYGPKHMETAMPVTKDQLSELLLQMLETEQGRVRVYERRSGVP